MAAGPARERERYIDQPYHVELVRSDAPGGGWTAEVEELPGCAARGASAEEAARGAEAAIRDWIDDALAEGREVPKPRLAASHSGRLLLRMPQSLHADLARAAEREDISLNQFITGSLAGSVQWRSGAGGPPAADETERSTPPARAVRAALVANVLVLVLIAALAVALLLLALSRG